MFPLIGRKFFGAFIFQNFSRWILLSVHPLKEVPWNVFKLKLMFDLHKGSFKNQSTLDNR